MRRDQAVGRHDAVDATRVGPADDWNDAVRLRQAIEHDIECVIGVHVHELTVEQRADGQIPLVGPAPFEDLIAGSHASEAIARADEDASLFRSSDLRPRVVDRDIRRNERDVGTHHVPRRAT